MCQIIDTTLYHQNCYKISSETTMSDKIPKLFLFIPSTDFINLPCITDKNNYKVLPNVRLPSSNTQMITLDLKS